MDSITISNLDSRIIIGIHPWERQHPQLVITSIKLTLDGRRAGMSGNLTDGIDYSAVGSIVRFILLSGRFYLLETAVESICATLFNLFHHAACLQEVQVVIKKPQALPGSACVSYSAIRQVGDYHVCPEKTDFGLIHEIFQNKQCKIFHLHLSKDIKSSHFSFKTGTYGIFSLTDCNPQLPAGRTIVGIKADTDAAPLNKTQAISKLLLVAQTEMDLAVLPANPSD